MEGLLRLVAMIGMVTIFITPLTLIVGIVNAIKKPEGQSRPYMIMAIISAYLIVMPIFGAMMLN
ncbi:hypothetical protein [Clostridium paridis]|uniref:Uncharacterized protein n=1 Tax=Clostridium paridis TaxID=2803863 RepID=A0A937FJ75_9CLOT|nr:hypothetical protein [Clostridium paridis]MBL4933228.1 hypothetical protein [Clostridium paridis]